MDVVDSSTTANSRNPDLFLIKADDLEIIDTVGEGGFGVVHRARHSRWGIVAFKKLNSEFIKRSEGNKWKKEAEIQSRLDHPNIIKFLALVFEPKNYGMVLEFAEHGDLSDYIAEHEPAWNQKLSLIHDTVSGMCYLHTFLPPIIHGDLKLQNILVSANLTAKICDFGFAQKMKEYSRSLSCSELKAGTVTHVPPEAWTHPNRPRSEKFDVYSFGICVWEIITGRKPFEGTQLCVIPTIVREVGFQPDLGLIPDEISRNMTDMIKSCWSQVADRRPTTIQIKESVGREMNILTGMEETNETKIK